MPRDSQGNPVHSMSRGKLNDELHAHNQGASKVVDPKSRAAGKQPDPDAEMREESPEDIHDIVNEHGPAHTIHMKSDHEAGVHQVTSFHGGHKPESSDGEGFTHHSKHSSHHEAHKHAGRALGMAEHEKAESPEYEAREEEKATIPGMA